MFRKSLILLVAAAIAAPGPALAQKVTYGDWQVDLSEQSAVTEASTVNTSGSVFGFICSISLNQCIYYVAPQTTCDQGSMSTILINSDAGALISTIRCTKIGNNYYNAIDDTNDLHNAVLKSSNIGFALPMKDGQFKVVRFSLSGASSAIGAAATRAAELVKNADHMM